MPSQEAGSNPAPGSPSGTPARQAQEAQETQQGAAATSPPRTEQELAQVRMRTKQSHPQAHAAQQQATLALGYFPQPRVCIFPSWTPFDDSAPRSWGFFRVLRRLVVAPPNGSQRSGPDGCRLTTCSPSQTVYPHISCAMPCAIFKPLLTSSLGLQGSRPVRNILP